MKVAIRGEGVAASCCSHLLQQAGFATISLRAERPGVPAIMLSDAAVELARDIFRRPHLFARAPRITRRVVRWGANAETLELEHGAVVVSEPELLAELEQREDFPEPAGAGRKSMGTPAFTIHASRPLPPDAAEHAFGSRFASAVPIRLIDALDSTSCWIESLENGWMFLIPNSPESGWLLTVGSSPESALAQSRLISGRIAAIGETRGSFPSSPRIVSPLYGPEWLACGTAGLAFDPICGDGTAHAIREAILASAVVRGIAKGRDPEELCAHYEARLTAGFQRHLMACHAFYRSGGSGSWWESEVELLRRGVEWCAAKLRSHGAFRYRLRDFELEAVTN
jgi:hypothetical protein